MSSTEVAAAPVPTIPEAPAPASKGKAAPKEKKAAKKATTKASSTKAKKAVSAKVSNAAHPSWKDIVKECIAENPGDARTGVSRSTIKKYAEKKYKIDMNGTALFQLNRAITSGAEKGYFVLPKGPSGKVKLAPKTKSNTSSKENAKPVSPKPKAKGKITATTKPAAKAAKAATAKKAPVKSTIAKKAAPKKSTTPKATTAKKSKTVTASTKKTSSKKLDVKKTAAKAAASRPKKSSAKPASNKPASKPSSKVKPASKKAKA
ncbi:hypothetical protein ACEPAF_4794 [Sanghuangporus sanghuang]